MIEMIRKALSSVGDPVSITLQHALHVLSILVKVQPLVRVEMEGSACWSLDWANSELLCVSTTHGACSFEYTRRYLIVD